MTERPHDSVFIPYHIIKEQNQEDRLRKLEAEVVALKKRVEWLETLNHVKEEE